MWDEEENKQTYNVYNFDFLYMCYYISAHTLNYSSSTTAPWNKEYRNEKKKKKREKNNEQIIYIHTHNTNYA